MGVAADATVRPWSEEAVRTMEAGSDWAMDDLSWAKWFWAAANSNFCCCSGSLREPRGARMSEPEFSRVGAEPSLRGWACAERTRTCTAGVAVGWAPEAACWGRAV